MEIFSVPAKAIFLFLLFLHAVTDLHAQPTPQNPLPFEQGEYNRLVTNELVTVAQNNSQDIINISPNVPGYVEWLSIGLSGTTGGNALRDSILNVYIDGEGSPSVTSDIAGLLGGNGGVGIGKWSTQHISWEIAIDPNTGQSGGTLYFRFPIPFHSSVRITITAMGSAISLWTEVGCRLNAPLPWKLKSSGRTVLAGIAAGSISPTNQGNGTIQFMNLPSGAGNSGVVVWHGATFGGASNDTYLENNIAMYLNGRTPAPGILPQVDSGGSETYFGSGFYFLATPSVPWQQNNWMAVSTKLTGAVAVGFDFLAANGGVNFNDGILIRWETGQRANPGVSTTSVFAAWTILFYVPN